MARAVVMVLILLLVVAYLSLFLAWNADPAPIATWELGARYTQDMPVGLLFIIGVMVGAVAMAIALWGPWQALKTSEQRQRALVEKAKTKLKSQSKEIKALTEELEEREREPGEEVPLSEEEEAAVAAVAASDEATKPEDESQEEPTDDPEVV